MVKKKGFGGLFRQEAREKMNETTLWIDNNEPLYRKKISFFKNYCRKTLKGKFNQNLAKKGFRHLTTVANQSYKKELGEPLPISDRRIAENILLRDFKDTIVDEGGCKEFLKRFKDY